MSPDEQIHERARMLAAESIDGPLAPADADWLQSHLDTCPDCAGVAAEYEAIHLEFRGLPTPPPPRDLWARTAAALDAVDGSAARGSAGRGRAAGAGRRPLFTTAAAVGVVVVVAVASVLVQTPIVNPGSGPANASNIALATNSSGTASEEAKPPLAVVNGTTYWLANDDTGVYQIKGAATQCVATDGSCTVTEASGQTLGSIASDSNVSAVIAPNASQAAVWSADKIAILPLSTTPQTVALDQLTPRPTIAATPTAAVTPTLVVTPTPAATPTHAATPTPAATPAAASASAPEQVSTPTATATPAATPRSTPTAAPTPKASPTAAAVRSTQPTAILSGYQIVGRDPEFSADGMRVAFSARPVDDSAGPDVFIWHYGDEQAEPVSTLHADLFAGWVGGRVLISEISGDVASATASAGVGPEAGGSAAYVSTSYIFDPETRVRLRIDRPMLLPAVDPTGRYLVYWTGSIEFDPTSGFRQPGQGDLYFDSWSNLTFTAQPLAPAAAPTPSAVLTLPPTPSFTPAEAGTETPSVAVSPTIRPISSPAASPTVDLSKQPVLLPVASKPGAVHEWVVRWDASGQHVAIWVANPGGNKVGRLSLFSIDPNTGSIETNEQLFGVDKVLSSVSFYDDYLVYTSAVDLKTYHQPVPAVPPSTASTPSPTVPGQLPTGAAASESAAPQTSDRPGD
jgi:hypothetical protein